MTTTRSNKKLSYKYSALISIFAFILGVVVGNNFIDVSRFNSVKILYDQEQNKIITKNLLNKNQ